MIISRCYIDTLTLYTDLTLLRIPTGWKKIQPRVSKSTSPLSNVPAKAKYRINYFIRSGKITLRYYPHISKLFISFSVPRLLTGSNYSNVDNLDIGVLKEELYTAIASVGIDVKLLPPTLFTWIPSRCDLFFHHIIPNGTSALHRKAYSCLRYPRYQDYTYLNTHYIMSNLKKYKNASTVIRIYDKTLEQYEKNCVDYNDYYPEHVHEDFEYAMELDERIPETAIRFEFSLRRDKLNYEFEESKKNPYNTGKKPILRDILNQQWQEYVINKFIQGLYLDKRILNMKEFKKYAAKYRLDKKKSLILVAKEIRSGKHPVSDNGTISQTTLVRYIKDLSIDGFHIVTTELPEGIQPVRFLPHKTMWLY